MRSQIFHDFDAFAESVRGVDSKMLLRNPKRHTWFTSSVDLRQLDFQMGRLGSGNIAQGQLRPDGFMVYLPLSRGVEYRANGTSLENGTFAVLEPGCEFCFSTKFDHDWCVVFVPTHLLDQRADLVTSASRRCWVSSANIQFAERFRNAMLQIFSTAAMESRFESSPAAERAVEAVLDILNRIGKTNSNTVARDAGRPKIPRQEIIRKSMDLLEQPSANRPSVQDLARAAGVSERTLRTTFHEHFGVGPVRFHQLQHLHQVHRSLKAAQPDEFTVSQILVEHGEWAFGRFALRYRQLFGELPSDTLRTTTR